MLKLDLRHTGWGGMVSIDLAQDRGLSKYFVNMVMNLRGPSNTGNS
jgi:hypothetical protein